MRAPGDQPLRRFRWLVPVMALVVLSACEASAARSASPTAVESPTSAGTTATPVQNPAASPGATGTPFASPATASPASPTVAVGTSPTPASPEDEDEERVEIESDEDIEFEQVSDDEGGRRNVIQVRNRNPNRLRMKGRVQLNHVHGDRVSPVNLALAVSGGQETDGGAQWACVGCKTMAVALQLNLYRRGASVVAPQNAALALNLKCKDCRTFAWALQYNLPVDDPRRVPREVRDLIEAMDRELRAIAKSDASIDEAKARVEAVLAQFGQLAADLNEQRDEEIGTTSEPTPAGTVQPAAVATLTSGTPVPSASGTPTPPTEPTVASATPSVGATATTAPTSGTPAHLGSSFCRKHAERAKRLVAGLGDRSVVGGCHLGR